MSQTWGLEPEAEKWAAWRRGGWLGTALVVASCLSPFALAAVRPVVEVEEDVYTYEDARNGADPMWNVGAPILSRWNEQLYASGLQTVAGVPPPNNCRWVLFGRQDNAAPGDPGSPWRRLRVAPVGLTREPCPLAIANYEASPGEIQGRIFLSNHPTTAPSQTSSQSGLPARSELIRFSTQDVLGNRLTQSPEWGGYTNFTEYSYRSIAADRLRGDLVLFINGGEWGSRWAYLSPQGVWSDTGEMRWPWGGTYERRQAIRIGHALVALQDRVAHFCGASEMPEPETAWREFKKPLLGTQPDRVSRRLFYIRASDISAGLFGSWIELANRENRAGTIVPGDLWVSPDEIAHIVWKEEAIDTRLQARFFPDATQSHGIYYAQLRRDTVVARQTLVLSVAGSSGEVPSWPRFQVTPDQRLFVCYYVSGTGTDGKPISENRLLELGANGTAQPPVRLPLEHPMDRYFTTTPRGGSLPSDTLELLGTRAGSPLTVSYARVRLQ